MSSQPLSLGAAGLAARCEAGSSWGRESMSDLAGEPREVSLRQAVGGHSADRLDRTRSCCSVPPDRAARSSAQEEGLPSRTPSCPHTGELSSGWGEFEGFRESSAKSEQFCRPFEPLGRHTEPPRAICDPKALRPRQARQGGLWVKSAASPSAELAVSCGDVFSFAFQDVPVGQTTEDGCSLDHFLEAGIEENSCTPVPRPCSESRKLWQALQNPNTVPTSQSFWRDSRCWENLLPVLGIDSAQKSLSKGQSHVLEESKDPEPEELAVGSFCWHHCNTLIQTTLSGTPGGGQGGLIPCSLFLKTPLHGRGHSISIPRKRIFAPRNLRLAFSGSGVC